MQVSRDLAEQGQQGNPLIVFVHVPKTAGSSVNRVLRRVARGGVEHCESVLTSPDLLRKRTASAGWISGHVPLDVLRGAVRAATDRPLHFFTAIREPTAQVASHYNWLIEIFHRGRSFYDDHPERIRAISERIRATDNSDPAAVIDNLRRFHGLFLNQQSRIVLGTRFDWTRGQLPKHLRAYDYVATDKTIPELVERLTGRPAPDMPRENASPYHFDPGIFSRGPLRNFLMRNNYLDWTLYRTVSDRAMRNAIWTRAAGTGQGAGFSGTNGSTSRRVSGG